MEQSLKSDSATAMFSTKVLLDLDLVGFVASLKGRAIQQFSSELGIEPDLAMEAVAITGAIAAGLATIFPRYINNFEHIHIIISKVQDNSIKYKMFIVNRLLI